jgi:hypothetical protein
VTEQVPDRVEQAVAAVEALRELIPQAHAATKDLRRAQRKLEESRRKMETAIEQMTEKALQEKVPPLLEKGLSAIGDDLATWSNSIYGQVTDYAMELVNIAVFGDPKGIPKDGTLLTDGIRMNKGDTSNMLVEHARKHSSGRSRQGPPRKKQDSE